MPATSRRHLRAELPVDAVVALVDTREQCPWDLSPLRMEAATLTSGDYTVRGLEQVVALERKALPDLVACIGVERERFERELARLRAFEVRAVIVEATWADLERGGWRSKVTPAAAVGSVLAWVSQGLPFLFPGDREAAQRVAARLLYLAARRHYRQLRAFGEAIIEAPEEPAQ